MNDKELIEKAIKRIPRGKPFFAETVSLKYAADLARSVLTRLSKKGMVARVARGIYVRPKTNRYLKKGEYLMPWPQEIIQLISKRTGEMIIPCGAMAENYVGLSTQIPVRPIYYTNGRSRTIKMNRRADIKLIHVNSKKIVLPGTITCMVVTALWEQRTKLIHPLLIKKIHNRLTSDEYAEVLKNLDKMPRWMRTAFVKYQNIDPSNQALEEDYYQGECSWWPNE